MMDEHLAFKKPQTFNPLLGVDVESEQVSFRMLWPNPGMTRSKFIKD